MSGGHSNTVDVVPCNTEGHYIWPTLTHVFSKLFDKSVTGKSLVSGRGVRDKMVDTEEHRETNGIQGGRQQDGLTQKIFFSPNIYI